MNNQPIDQKQIDALYNLLEPNSNAPLIAPEAINLPQKYVNAINSPIVDDTLYNYKALAERLEKEPVRPKVPTFFEPIDKLLDGGFQGGELVVLSGFTKGGKSTLMQTLTYCQAKHGISTVLFTLELGWQEFTRKYMAMDNPGMARPYAYSDLPLWYPIDNRALSLKWLELQIEKAIKRNKAQMAYIDHLHFLLPLKDYRQNVSFLVGGIVRELKKIAVKLDIPIMLIAHTRKMPVEIAPDMNSIRDSGLIVCESDFTFLVWRVREKEERKFQMEGGVIYKDESWVSLEANRRNGKTLKFKIYFKNNRFYDQNEYFQILEQERKINESSLAQTKQASSIIQQNEADTEQAAKEVFGEETPWYVGIDLKDDE